MSSDQTPSHNPRASATPRKSQRPASRRDKTPTIAQIEAEDTQIVPRVSESPAPNQRSLTHVVTQTFSTAANRSRAALAALLTPLLTPQIGDTKRRRILLVLVLALFLGTFSSAALLVVANATSGGVGLFALKAAPTRVRPSPTATESHLANLPLAPTGTPQPVSPQGCVGGLAPAPGQGPLGPIYTTHGYAGIGNEVALTFDDGPNPNFTPQILADLKSADMHATFFVVGRHAQAHPDLVQQEWAGGNAIGNHTFDHEWVPGLSRQKLQASLDETAQVIRQATGDSCVWLFRPPYGDLLPPVKVSTVAPGEPTPTPQQQVPVTVTQAWQVIHGAGYTPINWDTSGHDWLRPGVDSIVRQISGELRPGAIILMHDGAPDNEVQDRTQTVAALPAVLDAIRARGLRPVTLPQLLYDAGLVKRPVPPTPTPRPGRNAADGAPGTAPGTASAATPAAPLATAGSSVVLLALGIAQVTRRRRDRGEMLKETPNDTTSP